MREVEIKAAIAKDAVPGLTGWLEEQGFEALGSVRQEDDYYNHPARDFRKTDEAVRLRSVKAGDSPAETFITYKGKNMTEGGQSREELECGVGDAETMRSIMDRLGFVSVAPVYKTRSSFRKDDITVCLDEVDGLGTYFELEIICEEGSEDKARARLDKMLGELAFASPAIEPKTYLELILLKKQ